MHYRRKKVWGSNPQNYNRGCKIDIPRMYIGEKGYMIILRNRSGGETMR